MDVYNVSDHWQEYASMISDIRTVCPLQQLADYASKNFVANVFSYVATQPKLDSMDGIADKTLDISAIFGMFVKILHLLLIQLILVFYLIHKSFLLLDFFQERIKQKTNLRNNSLPICKTCFILMLKPEHYLKEKTCHSECMLSTM